jgi:hypothetical protein
MIWLLCGCLVDGALYRERLAQLTDDDGDHWTEDAGDCNDAAPDVHPKAAELCNDVDDDCDGSVDEAPPAWFLDNDEDGHGDAATSIETCDPPAGFVASDGDCDDDNPDVHPGAAETCNGFDDDCDDLIDNEDEDLEGGIALYTDDDDDGFGDDATEQLGCAGDKDLVDIGGDCDDTAPAVHPGAEPDICEDGVDTNCDGSGLGCAGSAATADALFFGEETGDEASGAIGSGVDFNGDGYDDLVIGARSNDDAGTDAGAAYLIPGPISRGEQRLSTAWTKLTGSAEGDRAGRALGFVGDVDADGVQDIAIAASLHDGSSTDAGAVYVISASDVAGGIADVATLGWAEIDGGHPSDYVGSAVAGAGDVDGDGRDDLWIGASGDDSGGGIYDPGSAFLLLGPIAPGLDRLDEVREAELIGGGYEASNIGTVIAAGDFNGDGLADVALGDRYYNTYGYVSGGVFLFAGPISGSVPLADANATVIAREAGDALGTSISSAGDFDGDGCDDFLVGAPTAGTTGEAYGILGATSLGPLSTRASDASIGTFQSGDPSVRGVGSSVAMGGDLDNDGTSDVLVGAAGSGALAQGVSFAVAGPVSGAVALHDAGGRVLLRLIGERANDGLGLNVAFTGAIAEAADESILFASSTLNTSATARTGGAYLFWDISP